MTLGNSLKRLASLITMVIIGTSIFVGCSDDKGGGSPVVSTTYTWNQHNQCVDQNNNVVASSYCQNSSGGICYNQYGQQIQCTNNNGGICYNQYGQQIQCTNNNGGICYNQYNQQVACNNNGGGSNSCSNGVFIYPYGCIPRDGCQAGHVRWNGQCIYVGQ